MSFATVNLTLVGARALLNKDFFGLSDPFAVVKFGGQQYITKVIKNNLNPEWNQEFIIQIAKPTGEIVINVFDHDRFFKNEFLGTKKIKIQELHDDLVVDDWFPLQKRSYKSNVAGDIHLKYYYLTEQTKQQKVKLKEQEEMQISKNQEQYDYLEETPGGPIPIEENEKEENEIPEIEEQGRNSISLERPKIKKKRIKYKRSPSGNLILDQTGNPITFKKKKKTKSKKRIVDKNGLRVSVRDLHAKKHNKSKKKKKFLRDEEGNIVLNEQGKPIQRPHKKIKLYKRDEMGELTLDENGDPIRMKKKKKEKKLTPEELEQKKLQDEEQEKLFQEYLAKMNNCVICGETKEPEDIFTLNCDHSFCSNCLGSHVENIVSLVHDNHSVDGICPKENCDLTLGEWVYRSFLDDKEFEEYQKKTIQNLVQSNEELFFCANDRCGEIIEKITYNKEDTDLENIDNKDNFGKKMSDDVIHHREEFRFRCRTCDTEFCASCRISPYHLGYNCEDWDKYLKSRQCRFCNTALNEKNKAPPPENAEDPCPLSLLDVCDDDDCIEKRELCCSEILECGHYCGGLKGEKKHLGCLVEDCPGNKGEQAGDDYCNVCWVEDLSSAPCIKLECDHMFHYSCILEKLNGKWPNARINFGFCECPLCKKWMKHPALEDEMKEHKKLLDNIKAKACQRLEYEGLKDDPAIKNKGERFYNDPAGFAMDRFSYFQCFECKKPYFGGQRQCDDGGGGEFDPTELVCGGCSGADIKDTCAEHGKDYIEHKCKFCCTVASWFCWGNTHFCDACHTKQNNGDYLSRKPKNAFKVCKGPSECPLGIAHPHVEEFSLGCSICRNLNQF